MNITINSYKVPSISRDGRIYTYNSYASSRSTSGGTGTGTILVSGSYVAKTGDTMTGELMMQDDIHIIDNKLLYLGTGDDYEIHHNASDTYHRSRLHGASIYFQGENTAGALRTLISMDPDASTALYYDGTAKIQTAVGGVNIVGDAHITDNNYLYLGTSDDYQMWHDATDTYFRSNLNGAATYFQGENTVGAVKTLIGMDPDNSVDLYYDNTKVLQTLADGIEIGTGDTGKITAGPDGNDYIEIDGGAGDTIKLFVNATERLEANSTGIDITGTLGVTGQITGNVTGDLTGNADTVTTNANLTGPITSVGNATSIASQTGTGTTFAVSAGPTFTGTVTAAVLNLGNTTLGYLPYDNATSLVDSPIFTDGTKVGIGTTSPTSKLHVETSAWDAGSNIPLVSFVNLDNNQVDSDTLFVRGGANSAASSIVKVQDYDGNTDFVILGDGKVGIGTTSPDYKLDVEGTTNNLFRVNATGTGYGGTLLANIYSERTSAGTNALLQVGSAYAPNTLYVEDSGKVGIGTTSPSEKLSLNNSIGVQTVTRYSNSNTGVSGTDGFVMGIEASGNGIIWNREANFIRFGTSALERMRILAGGNVGIGTTNPGQALSVTGSIMVSEDMSSNRFYSGFAGSGWQLENDAGLYGLSLDNLSVRGTMNVYELLIQQIRATNGSLWVSDNMKYEEDHGTDATYWRMGIESSGSAIRHTLAVGDIIKSQRFTGNELRSTILRVDAISNDTGSAYVRCPKTYQIGSDPEIGDEFVRIGSATNEDRRGAIYLTAADDDNPYMDVVHGVHSVSGSFTTKARLGNLDGITDTQAGLDGTQTNHYGLYSGNAHLKGTIFANDGNIGGWTITTGSIYYGTEDVDGYTADGITISTGSIHAENFYIDTDGKLFAQEATLAGAVTATSGLIGGFTIDGTEGIYAGDAATRVQMKKDAGFWAGATAIGDAPFSVTEAGALTATSATIGDATQYVSFDGTTLEVETPNFSLSAGGFVTASNLRLEDSAIIDSVTWNNITIDSSNWSSYISESTETANSYLLDISGNNSAIDDSSNGATFVRINELPADAVIGWIKTSKEPQGAAQGGMIIIQSAVAAGVSLQEDATQYPWGIGGSVDGLNIGISSDEGSLYDKSFIEGAYTIDQGERTMLTKSAHSWKIQSTTMPSRIEIASTISASVIHSEDGNFTDTITVNTIEDYDAGVVDINVLNLGNSTLGYLPYDNATSLVDSPIFTDGTKVGIGTATPQNMLELAYDTGDYNVDETNAILSFRIPRATIVGNNEIGKIQWTGDDGGVGSVGAEIRAVAAASWGTTDHPTKLIFATAPDGGTVLDRMTISETGKVGIGTTSPNKQFTVYQDDDTTDISAKGLPGAAAGSGSLIQNASGTTGAYANLDFRVGSWDGRIAGVYAGATNRGYISFVLDDATAAPKERFRMADDGNFHADGNMLAYSTTVPSDMILKKDVQTIEPALDTVMELNPVSFNWKDKERPGLQYGFIAQEIEKLYPAVVEEFDTPFLGKNLPKEEQQDKYKTVEYEQIIPILTKAIQEMNEKLDKQSIEIEELKKRLE